MGKTPSSKNKRPLPTEEYDDYEEAESAGSFWRLILLCYILVGVLAIGLAVVAPMVLYQHIRYSYTAELGEGLPDASVYFRVPSERQNYYVLPPEISLTEPGRYKLKLSTPWGIRAVRLITKDTAAPTAEDGHAVISRYAVSKELPAEAALANIYDPSGCTAEWIIQPEFGTVGSYDCLVRVTDSLGNSGDIPCTVNIIYPCERAVIERNGALPAPEAYFSIVPEGEITYLDTSAVNTAEYGDYPVKLTCAGIDYDAVLSVRDITPPTADTIARKTYNSFPLSPNAFISGAADNAEGAMTIAYISEPDWSRLGEQPVSLLLWDSAGNETRLETTVTIYADTGAPQLRIAADRYAYLDETVRYLKDVTAYDDIDPDVTITVDHSAVNPRQAGDYPVTYTATDHAGNSSSVTVTYHFLEPSVTEEALRETARDILARLFKDGMTDAEKAWAMYHYVYKQIDYRKNGVTHTDWRYAADYSLKNGVGDCYSSAALCYLLFSEAGYEIQIAEHYYVPNYNHFWNLVNIGTGWYHMDATWLNTDRVEEEWCFMRTEAEIQNHPFGDHYWGMVKENYPTVATKLFQR